MQVLQILLEQPGKLISREELQRRIWPSDTFVDFDHGINNAIKRLREALGDTAETPRYIETVPRRGYRFIGRTEGEHQPFRALAVLPLENLSRDPEQEYFAEGLTEALITTLAKIGELRITSRTSSMLYKGTRKALKEIARELDVDVLVEGTVLREGERVRITAQLIDPATDSHLWAESYEKDLRSVLALQSEVAQAIAREIRIRLTPQERVQIAQSQDVNPTAYEAYLKGRYYWNRRSGSSLMKCVEHFQQAITADPNHAAAYSGLADGLTISAVWSLLPPDKGCSKAKQLAQHAIELDPSLAEAHTSVAWATVFWDYDFVTAEREFERAIELNPRYATAHEWFGMALAL
jgi:TolB-like protein